MSTDTTPGGDAHAIQEAYRQYMQDTRKGPWDEDAFSDAVSPLLDALEAARRDAEARAKRLNDALLIVAAIADERGKRLSPYSPDTLSEDAQSEMGLHPGDVRRMAGPQRGKEQA